MKTRFNIFDRTLARQRRCTSAATGFLSGFLSILRGWGGGGAMQRLWDKEGARTIALFNARRMRQRGNYSVCVCVKSLLTSLRVYTTKMNLPASFSLLYLGFQLAEFDIK